MKFLVFLLLVTLINLSVTNGQESACRKWKGDKRTDLKNIIGHWYTYLEDTFFVGVNDTCSEYTVGWNATLQAIDLINTQNYIDKTTKFIKGRAHKTEFPGVFDIFYENGLILVIHVPFMTDDYIVFVGCFRDNDFIRIVTKEKNPSDEVKKIIEDKIAELNIDRSELIYSCSDD